MNIRWQIRKSIEHKDMSGKGLFVWYTVEPTNSFLRFFYKLWIPNYDPYVKMRDAIKKKSMLENRTWYNVTKNSSEVI